MTEQAELGNDIEERERLEEEEEIQAVGMVLAPIPSGALTTSPLDMPVELFQESLDRRKANRDAMMTWIRESLVEGTDFGRIHFVKKATCPLGAECKNPKHFAKPSLFKPGSEKILGMLGVTVNWPTLAQYEQMALDGKAIKDIILRCQAISASGEIVAEGMGARSVAQDSGDLNKALKMCKKSGMIDMTLTLGGLSEIFTQDIEDMKFKDSAPTPGESAANLSPVPEGTDTKAPKPKTTGKSDFEKQQQLYGYLCAIVGINPKSPRLSPNEQERLSATLIELTTFESEGETKSESSLRKLKGRWLNTALGKAKAKLGHATPKEELLELLKTPSLLKVLDAATINAMAKEADAAGFREEDCVKQILVVKGFIADAEKGQ